MLSTLARTALAAAVEKGTGVPPAGTLSTVLLTTGASLLMMKGRRPVGLALLAAGGIIRWRETIRPEPLRRVKPRQPAPLSAP